MTYCFKSQFYKPHTVSFHSNCSGYIGSRFGHFFRSIFCDHLGYC